MSIWQDILLVVKDLIEAHPKLARDFFLDKKNKDLFVNLIRAQSMFKINFNDVAIVQSLIRPLKGVVESLVATAPVIELLIEAEIKSLFAFKLNQKRLNRKVGAERSFGRTRLTAEPRHIQLEDFCAYFKPVIETRPKLFLRVFKRLCKVEQISFKKTLTSDPERFRAQAAQFGLKAPKDDFVFRRFSVVHLRDEVRLGEYDLEPLKSPSVLILLLFKDILFKLNKKSYLCKTLSR